MSFADYVAGFVVAEGSFTGTVGAPRPTYVFSVSLGATDASLCHTLALYFGVGHLHLAARRQPHYDDECTYSVSGAEQLAQVIVPFMDAHLPRDSYKWIQYERWRDALLRYRAGRIRQAGGRPCTEDGCGVRARAKGLCRRHYYEAYGR